MRRLQSRKGHTPFPCRSECLCTPESLLVAQRCISWLMVGIKKVTVPFYRGSYIKNFYCNLNFIVTRINNLFCQTLLLFKKKKKSNTIKQSQKLLKFAKSPSFSSHATIRTRGKFFFLFLFFLLNRARIILHCNSTSVFSLHFTWIPMLCTKDQKKCWRKADSS